MTAVFDLEERTFKFAKRVFEICKKLKRNHLLHEYIKQLVRASSSVGANYIEANESLSKKDFVYRIRICLKEAKESAFFLRLLKEIQDELQTELSELFQEAIELKKIFSSIIEKSK
jgi:four helix bundle protein